ncbi:MAG: hypothetical protein IH962_06545 [Chloroflexi bacterium]|nr:hypothetical protein [Chloroflexota bacterium]
MLEVTVGVPVAAGGTGLFSLEGVTCRGAGVTAGEAPGAPQVNIPTANNPAATSGVRL